jgi:putative oxidoreductase
MVKPAQMKTFSKILGTVSAALIVLLFVYAATLKLAGFGEFRFQLYRQTFPHIIADILVYALPAAEFAAVLLLLFSRTFFAGLLLSLALLSLFTAYIALVLLGFWAHVPCSCGGVLSRLGWKPHLLFNGCFIVLNLVAIVVHLKERRSVTA